MKKSLIAIATVLAAFVACSKNDELEKRVDALESRVTSIEEQIKTLNEKTIPGLQATVAAVQAGVTVTSVTASADGGYVILFSNGTTATIADGKDGSNGTNGTDGAKGDKGDTPVISAKEFEGEFYWTCDGEWMLDASGNKIPVHAATPQFRINEGKWEISYDGGTTWAVVERMGSAETGSITIEDKEDVVIFWIGETPYTVQKESSFSLVIESTKDLGVPAGVTLSIPYTIKGAKEGDAVEVEIFNVMGDWTATITRTSDVAGTIKVSPSSETVTDGKVFVYAANGNGKTDIKCLYLEDGKLSVITDATNITIPVEGGDFAIAVETNMTYTIQATNGGTSWITLNPASKATHIDSLLFTVLPNTTPVARTSEVSVLHPVTKSPVYTISVLQPGTSGLETKYEDYLGEWMVGTSLVKIVEKVKDSTYTVTGLTPISSSYGEAVAEAIYDSATGNFVMMEQKVAEAAVGSYGTCYFYLCGLFKYGSTIYPHYTAPKGNSSVPYVLLRGNITEQGIECVAGTSVAGSDFIGYCVRWIIQSGTSAGGGNYAYNSAKSANLPCVFEKPKPASDEYKQWLGQWVVPTSSSSFTITVTEKVANASYSVSGWQGNYTMADPATFNPENNSIEFYCNSSSKVASGVVLSLSSVEYTCDLYYYGFITKDGTSTTSVTGNYMTAYATMNEDGTATMNPSKVTLSGGSTYDVMRMGLYAKGKDADGNSKNIIVGSYCKNFPFSIARPSGTTSNSVEVPVASELAAEEVASIYSIALPAAIAR